MFSFAPMIVPETGSRRMKLFDRRQTDTMPVAPVGLEYQGPIQVYMPQVVGLFCSG